MNLLYKQSENTFTEKIYVELRVVQKQLPLNDLLWSSTIRQQQHSTANGNLKREKGNYKTAIKFYSFNVSPVICAHFIYYMTFGRICR